MRKDDNIDYLDDVDYFKAEVAQLRAQLAERGVELVIKEMRIDSLTAALDDVRNRWHDAEQDWMQLRAQLAERSREIAELRAAIVRLCGNAKTTLDLNEWLEIYAPEQWFAGYDVAESALMALKDYSESIVYLRAQLAAVPVAQLRRQYSIESMTVHDFGLDAQDVDAWLRSLGNVDGDESP